jgi:phenylpropionate dioxygenase-like ring-hydroxylating dioxygenase large terminal subunit
LAIKNVRLRPPGGRRQQGGTSMRHDVIEDVASLVKPGSVHRRLYDDPAIFELELERVFGSAWIYVGHESQVKHPGDYFCAYLGRKPVVAVRGPDGRVHVLHNQCAHRGALVVALDKGHTDEFQCCYHGWTYHLDGRLKAVPLQHGYPPGFDPKSPSMAMLHVPRVSSYRSFIFANQSSELTIARRVARLHDDVARRYGRSRSRRRA